MDDFDDVSWRNDSHPTQDSGLGTSLNKDENQQSDSSGLNGKRKASSSHQQAGDNADAVDLAGIGDGRLDCRVDSPMKENEGTKDVYVSYLVTTDVRASSGCVIPHFPNHLCSLGCQN